MIPATTTLRASRPLAKAQRREKRNCPQSPGVESRKSENSTQTSRFHRAPSFAPSRLRATSLCYLIAASIVAAGCGLFEPRDPEEPSQSSLNFKPPTEPSIVIDNLQSAIEQKNAANYVSCFSDESKGQPAFVFTPSPDAAALYAAAFDNWAMEDEQSYFLNLIARSSAQAFASLTLTAKGSTVSADSVVYGYDYTLIFEHSETGFPKTARGTLQFTLRVSQSNIWMIQRWVDFNTTTDISWSHFKGKFSN